MATKYESNEVGAELYYNVYLTTWRAQSFKPSVSHTLTSIKIRADRYDSGDPLSTLNFHIRAVDGTGKPTGSNLSSGTYDGTTLVYGSSFPFPLITVNMSSLILMAGTTYAIVMDASTGDSMEVQSDQTANYANGTVWWSTDSGATWSESAANGDMIFEEWGNPLTGNEGAGIIAVVETRLHYVDPYGVERFIEGTVVT